MVTDVFCNDPLCDRIRKGEKHPAHDSTTDQKKSESLQKIIEAGSAITGTTIGGIAGLVLGGQPGAILGAAIGTVASSVLKNVGTDLADRMLIEIISLLHEIFELSVRGLITTLSGGIILGITDIVPANMKPEGEGETLFKLMGLREVDEQDLKDIAQLLQ